jgi:hypothetical protein
MNAPDHQPSLWGEGGPPGTETLPLPLPDPSRHVYAVAGHPVRIGTSEFSFPDWDGAFYPRGMASGRRLRFYAPISHGQVQLTYYGIPEAGLAPARRPPRLDFVVKTRRHDARGGNPAESYDQLLPRHQAARRAARGHLAHFPGVSAARRSGTFSRCASASRARCLPSSATTRG